MTESDRDTPLGAESESILRALREQYAPLTRLLTPEDQPAAFYSPHIRLMEEVDATQ